MALKDSHIDATENTKSGINKMFDSHQQAISTALLKEGSLPFPLILSSKGDGMMLNMSFYPLSMLHLVRPLVGANEFGQSLITLAQKLGLPFIPAISTQNTFVVHTDSLSYIVTALMAQLGVPIDATQSPHDAFFNSGAADEFLRRMTTYHASLADKTTPHTLIMEAVCGNCKCAWGVEHKELATIYTNTFVLVLARAYGSRQEPHFAFTDAIRAMGFFEPLHWVCTESEQVSAMVTALALYSRGKMTAEEFFAMFPPVQSHCALPLLHPEGWCSWYNVGIWLYEKLKQSSYYLAHNPSDPLALYQLGLESNHFPTATAFVKFVKDMMTAFPKMVAKFCELFGYIGGVVDSRLVAGLTEKAALALAKMPPNKKFMMLANQQCWQPLCMEVVRVIMPQKDSFPAKFEGQVRDLLVHLAVWDAGVEERVRGFMESGDSKWLGFCFVFF